MISNGGSMKCGGCYKNVCLQIGHYHMKSHMFAIDMGIATLCLVLNGYAHSTPSPWILRT
jgi:hypothetical protein